MHLLIFNKTIKLITNYVIIIIAICALIAMLPDSRQDLYLMRIVAYLKTIFTLDFGFSSQYGFTIKELILSRAKSTALLLLLALTILILFTTILSLLVTSIRKSKITYTIELVINYLSSIPYLIYALIFLFTSFWIFQTVPILSDFDQSDLFNKSLILMLPSLTLAFGDGIFYDSFIKMKVAIEELHNEPWIKSIKAKGHSVTIHYIRGLIEPTASIISSKSTYLLSGSIIIEYIFTWQGIGLLLWETITYQGERDYPLLLATFSTILIFIFTVSYFREIISIYLNPQVYRLNN